MIWYVATLIASVISTRGLVAQGELKCSVPALPLPALSAPSSTPPAPRPRQAPCLSAGEARAGAGRAPGHCRGGRGTALAEGQAGRGPSPRAAGHWGKDALRCGSTSFTCGSRFSHQREEPGALSRSSRFLQRWGVGGFANSGCRGVCGCSGRLQHADAPRRDAAPQTGLCREARPRALGLSAPTAKGLGSRPAGAHRGSSRPS